MQTVSKTLHAVIVDNEFCISAVLGDLMRDDGPRTRQKRLQLRFVCQPARKFIVKRHICSWNIGIIWKPWFSYLPKLDALINDWLEEACAFPTR